LLDWGWIDGSIAALRQSVARGWTDFSHLQQDSDLAILRDVPEFKTLIPEASSILAPAQP
jgi:hypothetical protein